MTNELVKQKTEEPLKQHGLNGWKFEWLKKMNKFSKAGCCNYKTKTIKISPTFVELNDDDEVMNTILHEIAHALTPRHHHNKFWKRKAIEIGCTGATHYSIRVKRQK